MIGKNILPLLLGISWLACATSGSAQLFTAGDLLVSTYGNAGTAATNNNYTDGQATPITLDEFTTGGQLVLSDTLPTSGSGANVGLAGEFGSSSEGTLQLSGNDEYVTIAGYSGVASFANVGGPAGGYSTATGTALAQSTSSNIPRVAALIDDNGNVNTSTQINDLYTTNNPRSIYSPDGQNVFISGQGDTNSDTGQQGIYLAPVGTNTANGSPKPAPIFDSTNTRTVTEYNGNFYYSVDKASTGIFEFSGSPTSLQSGGGTQITAATNGLTGSSLVNYSPEGFFFANSTTLYVADTGDPKTGKNGDGGIQKWVLVGSAWQLQYTLRPSTFISPINVTAATAGETGFEAIAGEVVGGSVELFAVSYTAGDANPNGLYSITDALSSTTGSGDVFSEVASATDSNFKGVSFTPVPEPSSYAAIFGCVALFGALFIRRRRAESDCGQASRTGCRFRTS